MVVNLKEGPKKMTIHAVKNGKVYYQTRHGRAVITQSVPIRALANTEKVKRSGNELNGLALRMALEALKHYDYQCAKDYLCAAPHPLRDTMLKAVDDLRQQQIAKNMRAQLFLAFKLAGVPVTSRDNLAQNLELLKTARISTGLRTLLYGTARDVWRQSRSTPWINEHSTVALLKHMLSFKPPEDGDSDSDLTDSEEGSLSADTTNYAQDWRRKIDF